MLQIFSYFLGDTAQAPPSKYKYVVFAPPILNQPKPVRNQYFFFAFLESLGKFRNCHQAVLKNLMSD